MLGLPIAGSYHTELTAYTALRSGNEQLGFAMEAGLSAFYGGCDVVLSPSAVSDARLASMGVGGEHRAQLAHARGGLRAVAHHVADHEQQAAVLERVGDVEVAADVAPAGAGEVARGELDAGQRPAARRQQRALQREREPPLGAVEHGVVERDRGARGELDQHAPVERAADRVEHDDRAEHAPARDERERQRGPIAELGGELVRARSPSGAERGRGHARADRRQGREVADEVAGRRDVRDLEAAAAIAALRSRTIRSASATTTPSPNPLRITSERMSSSSSTSSVPGQPGAGAAEDLQAAGGGAAGGEGVLALAREPRRVLLGADAVGDVVEVDAQAVVARGRADVEPGVERRVVLLEADRAPVSAIARR